MPWETLLLSVVLFIVIPVIIAQVWRRALLANGTAALAATLKRLGPVSLIALLATLVLLFAFQGQQILAQPLIIVMLAVPILIQVYFNSGLAYWLNRRFGEAHCVAAPSALIGASNFFELAVATAIGLFGFNSGAALATVVGVWRSGVRRADRAALLGAADPAVGHPAMVAFEGEQDPASRRSSSCWRGDHRVHFNSGLAYWLNRRFGEAHCVAAPSALIGASNFFELAVATAIGLFGFNSGAALATVVGVLVDVPVMLSVVRITTATKDWYERAE